MPFEPIRELIPKAIDRSGDPPALLGSQVIALWPGVVRRVMPEKAWDKSRARKLSGGQLTVDVSSPAWVPEYRLRFPQLLREINRSARRNIIRQIFFRLR